MHKNMTRGFTLIELLIVVVLLGIIATVSLPSFSAYDQQKINVAAAEAANVLRLAISEARRTKGYVLVDGQSKPGHLQLYYSNALAEQPPVAGTSTVMDPLTKTAVDLNVTEGAFSKGVTLSPAFTTGGSSYPRLLIDGSNNADMRVFDTANNDKGSLEAGGVLLTLGEHQLPVYLGEKTGLVTWYGLF